MVVMNGDRTYGLSRIMEQDLAELHDTIMTGEPRSYRQDRQNPLAASKHDEHAVYAAQVQGGC